MSTPSTFLKKAIAFCKASSMARYFPSNTGLPCLPQLECHDLDDRLKEFALLLAAVPYLIPCS